MHGSCNQRMEKKKPFEWLAHASWQLPSMLLLVSQLSKVGSRSRHVLSWLLTSVAFRGVSKCTPTEDRPPANPPQSSWHLWESQLPGTLGLVTSSWPFGKGPAALPSFACGSHWLLLLVRQLHELSAELSLPGISFSLEQIFLRGQAFSELKSLS